ncbi:MAG: hypothetical protein LQ341_005596 [Variospora aurantia]|nr:MAG: hypothetical protein LQ341_005596 [Variospora aurantia]
MKALRSIVPNNYKTPRSCLYSNNHLLGSRLFSTAYATEIARRTQKKLSKRRIFWAVGAAVGAGAITLWDDVQHDRTLRVLEKNGSIYIKLGQHLSSMNYLLPLEWTQTFVPLQDKCPVSKYEAIEAMFVADTGQLISSHFDDFDQEPIGAASLAQVHLATMKDTGLRVAVKVQHPALQEWVPLDLALTRFTFAMLKYFFPAYNLDWLSNEMEQSLPQELNFALEGLNARRTRRHFSLIRDCPLVIPDVIWGRKRILVMEYIAGHRIDDLTYLDANRIDRDEVSAALARIFNEMIFGDNCSLHCDPHGGNIALRYNGLRRRHNFDIILYDHGLYREIPLQLKRDYAKLWLAVIDADENSMRKYAHRVAGILDEQFPLFASAITGRDYRAVSRSVVSARSKEEKEVISGAMGEGLLQQLVQLLGQGETLPKLPARETRRLMSKFPVVPRIILLILKTNDLTRSLDESLKTRAGPVRNFMILARYCSRTIFQEQVEVIRSQGSTLWPRNMFRLFAAWTSYVRIEAKLVIYEWYIFVRRIARFLGFSSSARA